MNRKHICLVHKDIADISRGGISTLFKAVAKGLVTNGFEVTVITQQPFRNSSMKVIRLSKESDKEQHSQNVSKIIESINPDVVEASSWGWEILDYLRKSPDPKTQTVIRMEPTAFTLFQDSDLANNEREQALLADHLLAVSQYAKEDVIANYHINRPITVISNAIDQGSLRAINIQDKLHSGEILIDKEWVSLNNYPINQIIDSKRTNIFWVGKPTKMKGFDILGDIIGAADENEFKFIINIGWSKEFVKWTDRLKSKCVFIRGLEREDQISIWSHVDLFLNTSRWEGFGLVLLESATIGIPIIANRACTVYHEFFNPSWGKLIDMEDRQKVVEQLRAVSHKKGEYSFSGLDFYDLPSFNIRNLKFYNSI